MKKPTSTDVAKLAGVSQTTVSLILNGSGKSTFPEETKQKVYDAARELDYKVATRKRPSHNDGGQVLLVLIPTLMNQYYSDLVSYVAEYADSLHYQVIVCNTFRKPALEQFYLNTFAGKSAAGIIYTFLPAYPHLAEELDATVPTVIIGEKQGDLKICSIELSSEKAGAILAQHLIDLGHRKLAFISNPLRRLNMTHTQRLEGIRKQFELAGLHDSIRVLTPDEEGDADWEKGLPYGYSLGRKLTAKLIESNTDVTAIIGVNDMTALGILNELTLRGLRVPKDYSVCGFDNIFSSQTVTPSLTTIDHYMKVRCESAVDMILSRLQTSNAERAFAHKIEYAPQLVIRESTGAAPGIRGKQAQGDKQKAD